MLMTRLWVGTGNIGRYWRTPEDIIDERGSDGYWECGVQESGWVLRTQVGLSFPHLRTCPPLQ